MISTPIIVVSGLPRSGTSMMMQMLEAGGVPIYGEARRQADADNPRGYYELARVKELVKTQHHTWLGAAQGKAVKIISPLLQELPGAYAYQVILMNRDLSEVLLSQNKMLARRGQQADKDANDKLRASFAKHLHEIKNWLGQQANFKVIAVDYRQVVNAPAVQAKRLQEFLEINLNLEKMAAVADEKLYRNR